MAGKLVTIATFDQPPKARLAQNLLQAAGIKAAVADENTVAMDWLLGNAVGWVKVQVLEEDAERAVAVLEETMGKEEPVSEEELAAEAESTPPEEDEPAAEPVPLPPITPAAGDPAEDGAEPKLSERDEYARRFFFAAVFSLVFGPLWFYAVYLFLNAAFGEGPISSHAKRKLFFGGAVLAFCSVTSYVVFMFVFASCGRFLP